MSSFLPPAAASALSDMAQDRSEVVGELFRTAHADCRQQDRDYTLEAVSKVALEFHVAAAEEELVAARLRNRELASRAAQLERVLLARRGLYAARLGLGPPWRREGDEEAEEARRGTGLVMDVPASETATGGTVAAAASSASRTSHAVQASRKRLVREELLRTMSVVFPNAEAMFAEASGAVPFHASPGAV
eukprot:TRINITY_DN7054_c1_g1_i1.p1 TRINITY_DN7054_c1_g1~~TRINITY_DN7054_c1_g1_i1.p1  ORF type:complete len:208 (-),score=56.94 TRINITY_DN7054_c1_g1_i1:27-599(-)